MRSRWQAEVAGVSRRSVLAAAVTTAALVRTGVGMDGGADSGGQNESKHIVPVAFLLDAGATVIDFAGPWETFQDVDAGAGRGFQLYTVAASAEPLQTEGSPVDTRMKGITITPSYTFSTAPPAKVLVIGAQGGGRSEEKHAWIRRVAASADVIMSVCTGAFILARTGLLDGLRATTHHEFYDAFEKEFPRVSLVRGRRFVDNGKMVSAGGLTSGIDAALHIVARYYGTSIAKRTADYMEHYSSDWVSGDPARGGTGT
jgi:transcriptional regulator GlxA family with amidase domain